MNEMKTMPITMREIDVESQREFNPKDLSLLEKFLIPLGIFSGGFALGGLIYPKNFPYTLIAAAVATISILGGETSFVCRPDNKYQEELGELK